jgi:hypothetical protein
LQATTRAALEVLKKDNKHSIIKTKEDSDSDYVIIKPSSRKPGIPKRRGNRKDNDNDKRSTRKGVSMFASLVSRNREIAITAYYSALGASHR